MITVLKKILDSLFSLRTTLWLLGFMLVLMLAGAVIMPGERAFQQLRTMPLFDWIGEQPAGTTWWLWGLIGLLSLLTVNTFFCSVESIIKKRRVTQWLLLISPQVIHIGFLFVLLAHLLSSLYAYEKMTTIYEGALIKLDDSMALKIKDIDVDIDYYGYISDWKVDVAYVSKGTTIVEDSIKPNDPSDKQGLNINVKNVRPYPRKVAYLQISYEPGARWALVGGILFMIGIVTLIALKIRLEK